jgi:endogenous inhibitor of DNA gyrase (YacG/DUF329 family)
MATYKCTKCKKHFGRVGNKLYRFCSRECYGLSKIVDKKTKKCLICGIDFRYKTEQKDRKYCSTKCSNRSFIKSIEKECLFCKKKFSTRPSQNAKYCSHKCFYNRNDGKTKQYGWTKYKKVYKVGRGKIWEHRLVMEEKLGRVLESWEQVHHIDGNPKNNNIENLMIVLPREHNIYTIMQRKIKKLTEENNILRRGK